MNIYSLNLISFNVFVFLFSTAGLGYSHHASESLVSHFSADIPLCAQPFVSLSPCVTCLWFVEMESWHISLLCLPFIQPSVSDIHLLVDCFNSSAILLSSINAYEYIILFSYFPNDGH